MFTYTLGVACFLLIISWFWKRMLIFMALFLSWGGVIYIIADMSKYQDMGQSLPLQCIAGVIMLWSVLQIIQTRKGGAV